MSIPFLLEIAINLLYGKWATISKFDTVGGSSEIKQIDKKDLVNQIVL